MFVCPVCHQQFEDKDEDIFVKHYVKCWMEHNPHHKSKSAPRSEDVNTRKVGDEVRNFFESFEVQPCKKFP